MHSWVNFSSTHLLVIIFQPKISEMSSCLKYYALIFNSTFDHNYESSLWKSLCNFWKFISQERYIRILISGANWEYFKVVYLRNVIYVNPTAWVWRILFFFLLLFTWFFVRFFYFLFIFFLYKPLLWVQFLHHFHL